MLRQFYRNEFEMLESQPRSLMHHSSGDRVLRIANNLRPYIANGTLIFREDTDSELFYQLAQFPTTHDDGPDALEGAVSHLMTRVNAPETQRRSIPKRRKISRRRLHNS
jgi:phage terminase large subunit-like protein